MIRSVAMPRGIGSDDASDIGLPPGSRGEHIKERAATSAIGGVKPGGTAG
jgi:hypothetical protein